jgi:hypothetical protein
MIFMNILFISMIPFESNASATIRNKSLIKGLVNLGHSVDTMTMKPLENSINYDNTMNDISSLVGNSYYINANPIYNKFMAKKGNINLISNIQKNSNKKGRNIIRKFRHIIKNIFDNTSVFDAQKLNVNGVSEIKINYCMYDVIISSSDPKSSHLLARRIFKENKTCKAKWVQYWGDPMLNDITRKCDWRNGLVRYHEGKLLSKADRVIYVSPLTLNEQKGTFKEFSYKMDFANQSVANFYNNIYNKNNNKDETIKVGYFGAYYSTVRNIMPLYNSVRASNFVLNICGESDIALDSMENILIEKKLSYKEVVKREEDSDIIVCICNLKGAQIPGKIYYSAGYAKPIIIILDGEHKNYLRSYFNMFNRFILCDNEENSVKEAIEIAISQLKNKDFNIPEQLKPEYVAKKVLGDI